MAEPVWIREDVVLAIHQRQIAEHGGLNGVRDHTLLTSAVSRPQNLFACGNPKPDLAALAASYGYGIARNHPFVDGNKRTTLVVLQLFLRLNDRVLNTTAVDKYQAMIKLAAGSEAKLAEWIRKR